MPLLAILTLSLLSLPAFAKTPPTEVLQSFSYSDVQVLGGPMAAQAAASRSFFLNLDEDSLLQGFRLRAGLPAPGHPMGGWYDPEDFAGAHSFGQYVSALSRMYANTQDVRFKEKVARLVHGFHQTIAADGFFYSSDKAAREWPCYIYDKNAMGMRNAYTLTGNSEALEVLSKMTDWAEKNLPRRSDEWYTLSEGFYLSYELTKEPRYLKLAAEFDYSQGFFDLFANGTNAFTPDRHAYSHVNSLLSAAQAYESTGEVKYLTAIENAWRFLTETQMYASGGWGPGEHFVLAGQGKLAESLQTEPRGFETPCGTYANMNLNRYLLRFTGKSKYGDNMDRVLLNGILAALPMQPNGQTFYYSNYRAGANKEYFPYAWPCCSGTYAQITADYPLNIFFHDKHGIYVNLFAQSSVEWKRSHGVVRLEQKTEYPLSDKTAIQVHTRRPARFTLHVRVPKWLKKGALVLLNGRTLDVPGTPGTFIAVDRQWREGDLLEVTLPTELRFEAIDSLNPDRAALMKGPLMLVALAKGDVTLTGDIQAPGRWIKPVPGTMADFITPDGKVFRPFYSIQDESYTSYPKIVGNAP